MMSPQMNANERKCVLHGFNPGVNTAVSSPVHSNGNNTTQEYDLRSLAFICGLKLVPELGIKDSVTIEVNGGEQKVYG